MKKLVLLILVCCFLFCGCSQNVNDFLNTPVYPNLSGEYVMVVDNLEEGNALPKITYNDYTKEFTFTYDLLSSYLSVGKVKQVGNKKIMTTNDEKYKYVFEILNTYTLKFVANESSSVQLIDKNLGIPIEDGAIFQIPGEREKREKYRQKELQEEDNFTYWAY